MTTTTKTQLQFRVVWYLTMAALEDESCQRYGMTAIDYHSFVDERSSSRKDKNFSDNGRQFLNESYRRTHLLRDGLPGTFSLRRNESEPTHVLKSSFSQYSL